MIMTVAKSKSAKLRLYTEEAPKPAPKPAEAIASLPDVLRDFGRATGWSLEFTLANSGRATSDVEFAPKGKKESAAGKKSAATGKKESATGNKKSLSWSAPVTPGVGAPLGHLRLDLTEEAAASCAVESARALALSLAGMIGEMMQTRHALWQREAELAAGIPLVPHDAEEKHLAARLEAVLRGGSEAVDCQAAALYLLDDATSHLKMRLCWGLPLDRLVAPARPLKGAVADLEALLGHAVVIEDSDVLRHWNVPEEFPAAVCVPVSTSTTLLGTLWIFSAKRRDFSSRQTNLLEIIAGRLAADLEREILLRDAVAAAEVKRQLFAAERLQSNQLPTISPLLDGWQLAGWTTQVDGLGGDFHDWFCLRNGLLAVAVGHAMNRGVEAALAAGGMKAALRAHGQYCREAQQTLKRLNLTTWTGSAGDQHGSLFFGLIQTSTGQICCASAGQPSVLRIRPDGWESLSRVSPQLGESPESDYEQNAWELQPGEVLVVFTEGVRDAANQTGAVLGEAGVAEALLGRLDLSAEELAASVRSRLEDASGSSVSRDRTVLVVKRKCLTTGAAPVH